VRGELNALVLELVSQEFVERAEVNEERDLLELALSSK
jgi:hypothetical protein